MNSIEAATKQSLWNLSLEEKIPNELSAASRIQQYHIAGKTTRVYLDTAENPNLKLNTYDHTHIMSHTIGTTSALGFILHDLDQEFY